MQTYLHEITVFNFIVGEAKGGMLPVLCVLAVSQDRNLKTSPEMDTEPGALAGVAEFYHQSTLGSCSISGQKSEEMIRN